MEETMGLSLEELKQEAIDRYCDLLRIKSCEKGVNEELERQLVQSRMKLQSFAIDYSELEKVFLMG